MVTRIRLNSPAGQAALEIEKLEIEAARKKADLGFSTEEEKQSLIWSAIRRRILSPVRIVRCVTGRTGREFSLFTWRIMMDFNRSGPVKLKRSGPVKLKPAWAVNQGDIFGSPTLERLLEATQDAAIMDPEGTPVESFRTNDLGGSIVNSMNWPPVFAGKQHYTIRTFALDWDTHELVHVWRDVVTPEGAAARWAVGSRFDIRALATDGVEVDREAYFKMKRIVQSIVADRGVPNLRDPKVQEEWSDLLRKNRWKEQD